MGAWGPGIFDDDSACDYVDAIEDSDNPREIFESAFQTAVDSDYLEYDDCHAVTVSASYIDSILNGTRPSPEGEAENFLQFVEKNKHLNLSDLKPLAVQALNVVISEQSELNELWLENQEHYPTWKRNIEELIKRLK